MDKTTQTEPTKPTLTKEDIDKFKERSRKLATMLVEARDRYNEAREEYNDAVQNAHSDLENEAAKYDEALSECEDFTAELNEVEWKEEDNDPNEQAWASIVSGWDKLDFDFCVPDCPDEADEASPGDIEGELDME